MVLCEQEMQVRVLRQAPPFQGAGHEAGVREDGVDGDEGVVFAAEDGVAGFGGEEFQEVGFV